MWSAVQISRFKRDKGCAGDVQTSSVTYAQSPYTYNTSQRYAAATTDVIGRGSFVCGLMAVFAVFSVQRTISYVGYATPFDQTPVMLL